MLPTTNVDLLPVICKFLLRTMNIYDASYPVEVRLWGPLGTSLKVFFVKILLAVISVSSVVSKTLLDRQEVETSTVYHQPKQDDEPVVIEPREAEEIVPSLNHGAKVSHLIV
jgi:hypothetical protein